MKGGEGDTITKDLKCNFIFLTTSGSRFRTDNIVDVEGGVEYKRWLMDWEDNTV